MSTEDESHEKYSVKQIRKAFEHHAGIDDWGIKSHYENTLISALRREFNKPKSIIS